MTIKVDLSEKSINEAIAELQKYKNGLQRKAALIAKKLADKGYEVAYEVLSGHVFSGETLESFKLTQLAENKYVLSAKSKAILFFEFGAGVTYGGGHPWDSEYNMGPGTYPGNGHWDDPNGWWFATDDPRLIISETTDKNGNKQGWGHSYGNKPYMPFYKARTQMEKDLLSIAREVFNDD